MMRNVKLNMQAIGLLLLSALGFISCSAPMNQGLVQNAKDDIFRTEREFESMASSKGLSEAFSYYADPAACLNRGNRLICGKDSIRKFYSAPGYSKVRLAWKPDFVEVAKSGDMGYTYGRYTFEATDSTGKSSVSTGIFHTVWKKQVNGEWRFVWD